MNTCQKTVRRMLTTTLVAPAIGTAISLSGCAAWSGSTVREVGPRITTQTLERIELGKTHGNVLYAAFGAPSTRRKVHGFEDLEIVTYRHECIRRSHVVVLFAFIGSDTETEHSTAYFEMTNGIITNAWVS